MKKSVIIKLVREVLKELDEANVTGGTASFTPGTGAQYATPFAFSKKRGKNRVVNFLKKQGYKKVERPKRPSHTKAFDYL
jgi:hypothetical protein